MPWQPSADIEQLQLRARVISQIRAFFAARNLLEVDTPVMSHYGVSDPHIDSIAAGYATHGDLSDQPMTQPMYLMSSPEYAMKRLLAAGSGNIYQIAKAFRNGEVGRRHNTEFTLLEWYRLDFDLQQLMQEVAELIDTVLKGAVLEWHFWSYRQAFETILSINPLTASDADIQAKALAHVDIQMDACAPRNTWLDLLMSHCIEPKLPTACFIFDYPASQAALARLYTDEFGHQVARRFEVYVNGIELANGYHELTDAHEQERRFALDNVTRLTMGKTPMAADIRLLQALQAGLPECAGVALGIERLLMLTSGETDIAKVMAFNHPLA
jgi:lysyl-tRNA synthetase class 2|tara:strand:- start:111 stop:1091 length:981 start_codon:yes stop_codon:yes gene_type:complete